MNVEMFNLFLCSSDVHVQVNYRKHILTTKKTISSMVNDNAINGDHICGHHANEAIPIPSES